MFYYNIYLFFKTINTFVNFKQQITAKFLAVDIVNK